MKKSERLHVIIDLYAQQEKLSLEQLGACQQKHQAMEQQLQNLINYRQEYEENNNNFENRGVSINRLMEYRAFIDKLNKAIEAQQQMIEAKNTELAAYRKTWMQKHQKTESLQKVSDLAAREEEKLENKREQNEQDDRASRGSRNSGSGIA